MPGKRLENDSQPEIILGKCYKKSLLAESIYVITREKYFPLVMTLGSNPQKIKEGYFLI